MCQPYPLFAAQAYKQKAALQNYRQCQMHSVMAAEKVRLGSDFIEVIFSAVDMEFIVVRWAPTRVPKAGKVLH